MRFLIGYGTGALFTWAVLIALFVLRERESPGYFDTRDYLMLMMSGLIWPVTWLIVVFALIVPALIRYLAGVL